MCFQGRAHLQPPIIAETARNEGRGRALVTTSNNSGYRQRKRKKSTLSNFSAPHITMSVGFTMLDYLSPARTRGFFYRGDSSPSPKHNNQPAPSLAPTTSARDGKLLGVPLLPQVIQLRPPHALLPLVDVRAAQHLVCVCVYLMAIDRCRIRMKRWGESEGWAHPGLSRLFFPGCRPRTLMLLMKGL